MKKSSYKTYMKPFCYQQPGSPDTKDTCRGHEPKEIPGFSSYILNLHLPLSQLCCPNAGDMPGNAGIANTRSTAVKQALKFSPVLAAEDPANRGKFLLLTVQAERSSGASFARTRLLSVL